MIYLYIYLAIGIAVSLHPVAVEDALGIYEDTKNYRRYRILSLLIIAITAIIFWPVNFYGIIRRGK